MMFGQILKGVNAEWDKQIEFREEERRIAEERGFRAEQDEKSWSRQLENQKLGWDREDAKKRAEEKKASEELLSAYGMIPGFSKFKPAQIASFAKAGSVGYEALNTTVRDYLKAGGDIEGLINYNYSNTGGTTDSLISDINSTSTLFNQKALTNAFKKNSEKPNSVDLNISAAASTLFDLKKKSTDLVAIEAAKKELNQWYEVKRNMANQKDKDAPSTLTKTSLSGVFEGNKEAAFSQMSIQFDIQESKAIRRKGEDDVGTVDQFDSLANYIAAENMKEYFDGFTNKNDRKRATNFINATKKTSLIGMKSYADKQFSQYRNNQNNISVKDLQTKTEQGKLYQHFQSGQEFVEYLKSGKQKVGAIASVYQNNVIKLFIISPFKQGFVRLGVYDPNKYVVEKLDK